MPDNLLIWILAISMLFGYGFCLAACFMFIAWCLVAWALAVMDGWLVKLGKWTKRG